MVQTNSACAVDVSRQEIRPLILSVLKSSSAGLSPLDVLDKLIAQGTDEEVLRAEIIAMLAESLIAMTPTRKLQLIVGCAKAATARV